MKYGWGKMMEKLLAMLPVQCQKKKEKKKVTRSVSSNRTFSLIIGGNGWKLQYSFNTILKRNMKGSEFLEEEYCEPPVYRGES